MAYLSRLRLTNFRNLTRLDVGLNPGVTVFYGPNAQGKTTLLEAVYLLCIARSFRAENEREVVNFAAGNEGEQALVDGAIERDGQRLRVIVGYQPTARSNSENNGLGYNVRKEIRVNRQRRTAGELIGEVNGVLFSAADIELVQGPPSGRRRFLDILLSQADSLYLKGLQRYQRVVQQRNQLLRLLREGRAADGELSFWNDELVREGSWITWRRSEAMRRLAQACRRHHEELSGPEDDLAVEYRPSVVLADDVSGTETNFREALAAASQRERTRPVTAVGPHRDDFNLLIDGADMGTFASRGQARTLALTLRLAEAEFLASVREEGPVVLLDDALSEMDSDRRHRLLEKATEYEQVLITTTDLEQLSDFFGSGAEYIRVSNGQVWPSDQYGNVDDSPVVPPEAYAEAERSSDDSG
ncbi:MAG: DNA replication/repair protein RecF [Chloroflexi bacterium]|nr:DNA replication/repair protein RecF [Chloroflexota bacterium]MDA1271315.1 DNA replication/repair protein RecF [Chloroflexota bacterium]PKB58202.1 MAG: DNA replication/repair protein RecF [SAR202 cluster bacterium Casp-Chloro-G2]